MMMAAMERRSREDLLEDSKSLYRQIVDALPKLEDAVRDKNVDDAFALITRVRSLLEQYDAACVDLSGSIQSSHLMPRFTEAVKAFEQYSGFNMKSKATGLVDELHDALQILTTQGIVPTELPFARDIDRELASLGSVNTGPRGAIFDLLTRAKSQADGLKAIGEVYSNEEFASLLQSNPALQEHADALKQHQASILDQNWMKRLRESMNNSLRDVGPSFVLSWNENGIPGRLQYLATLLHSATPYLLGDNAADMNGQLEHLKKFLPLHCAGKIVSDIKKATTGAPDSITSLYTLQKLLEVFSLVIEPCKDDGEARVLIVNLTKAAREFLEKEAGDVTEEYDRERIQQTTEALKTIEVL